MIKTRMGQPVFEVISATITPYLLEPDDKYNTTHIIIIYKRDYTDPNIKVCVLFRAGRGARNIGLKPYNEYLIIGGSIYACSSHEAEARDCLEGLIHIRKLKVNHVIKEAIQQAIGAKLSDD